MAPAWFLMLGAALAARAASSQGAHHYEWDIGWKSAVLNTANLFFALVDLKRFEELPDVFIVPSQVIAAYFEEGPEHWPRARYHPLIEDLEPYKNRWDILGMRLTEGDGKTL
jgi:hypothetical protein